jgi:hypothetical protein
MEPFFDAVELLQYGHEAESWVKNIMHAYTKIDGAI